MRMPGKAMPRLQQSTSSSDNRSDPAPSCVSEAGLPTSHPFGNIFKFTMVIKHVHQWYRNNRRNSNDNKTATSAPLAQWHCPFRNSKTDTGKDGPGRVIEEDHSAASHRGNPRGRSPLRRCGIQNSSQASSWLRVASGKRDQEKQG